MSEDIKKYFTGSINAPINDDLRYLRDELLQLTSDIALNSADYKKACEALNTANKVIKGLKQTTVV